MQSVHAVAVAVEVGKRWVQQERYASVEHLAAALGIPLVAVELAVSNLSKRGILAKTEDALTLARPPDSIRLQDLVLASHGQPIAADELPDTPPMLDAYRTIEGFRSTNATSSANQSLTDLIAPVSVEA